MKIVICTKQFPSVEAIGFNHETRTWALPGAWWMPADCRGSNKSA